MAQYRQPVGYGLSEALPKLSPFPVQSKRAPTTADKGFLPGTLWCYLTTNQVYVLASIVNNLATWNLLESSGSAGVFTTLTSTGATTLATTGASVNTFGNTTAGTTLNLLVGTSFTVTGAAAATITIGTGVTTGAISLADAQTTGTLNIGGTGANTGTITIAGGTGAQIIDIATSGTGAKTIQIGSGVAGSDNFIGIGSLNGTSSLDLYSGSQGMTISSLAGQIAILSSDAAADAILLTASNANGGVTVTTLLGGFTVGTTGPVLVNSATGTIGLSTDATATAVSLATGAGAKTVIVGSATAGSTLALRSTATAGVVFSNGTQAPGIFVGTGAPVINAPQGSLYLNVAGSGAGDRLYVNTNGTNGWTNFVSAA